MASQMPVLNMANMLTELQFRQWKTMFEHLTGLQLAAQRDSLVRSVLEARVYETRCASVDEYLNQLQNLPSFSRREWDVLIEKVVIGETRFFRYGSAFDYIGKYLTEKLRAVGGKEQEKVAAWSVGCSSGEEAFTLAMIMHRICRGNKLQVPYSVIGTDINGVSLQRAAQGTYKNIGDRGVDENTAAVFFDCLGNGTYRVKKFLRSRVAFFRHNMLEPVASALIPQMDIISCQNVLMYLQPWRRRAVIRHLVSFLKLDGILVLCPGDLSGWKPGNLERVSAPGVLAYRRIY